MPFYGSKHPPAPSYNTVVLADGPVGFWDSAGTDLTGSAEHRRADRITDYSATA